MFCLDVSFVQSGSSVKVTTVVEDPRLTVSSSLLRRRDIDLLEVSETEKEMSRETSDSEKTKGFESQTYSKKNRGLDIVKVKYK